MATPLPDYSANLPSPLNFTWVFGNSIKEYGGFSGFHKAANSCLHGIFPDLGTYEGFRLNPDDLLDFSDKYVNVDDMIWENKNPLVFGAIGVVFAFSLLLLGMVWCCFKCCCSKSMKSSKEAEPGWEYVQNRFGGSSRMDLTTGNPEKSSSGGGSKWCKIGLGVGLACFGAVYLSCVISLFVTNEQFKDATSTIFDEVDAAYTDAQTYIKLTQKQIDAVFVKSFHEFANNLGINCAITCDPDVDPFCAHFCPIGDILEEQANNFIDALNQVPINEAKEDIADVEQAFDDSRNAVFQSINGVNLLLLLFLLLISIGFACYACSATRKVGNIVVTCGLVFIFAIGWIVWIFCLGVFYLSGAMVVVVPGAIDNIASNGSLVNGASITRAVDYKLPPVPHILQNCKESQSAYVVFELMQFYDIEDIQYQFCNALCSIPEVTCGTSTTANCERGMELDCRYFLPAKDLCDQAKHYSDFVETAIGTEVGSCEPLYHVINSTVHIFSYQLGSPVGGYWFGLNFLLFLLYPIVILAIVLQEMLK